MVELAFDMNPLVKVARPEAENVELRFRVFVVRAPMTADCEKRLVELAVVEKREVDVAFASVVFPVTPSVPATERLPAESIVVVALPLKYAIPTLEKMVDDAFANDCSAVQTFALPRLSVREVEPPREMVPPPERPVPAETVSEEFWSWLLPMVVVDTKDVPLYERRVPCVNEVEFVPPDAMPSALPRVRVPIVPDCEKRFVDDAMVEKKLVLVALVVDSTGNVFVDAVDVAVKNGADTEVYAVTEPRKREFPRTSKMLPVVDVALAPSTKTFDTVEG